MDKVFFSVIIPTYNRAGFISKTIKSILTQTYTNFEIIVVDDGSSDNTKEVISKIKDDRVQYYYKENAERGAARNYGATKAKGEYLNFFDSDDFAYTNHLQEAHNLINNHKSPKIFALAYEQELDNNKVKKVYYKNINKELIYGNLLSCNPVFVKKSIFSSIKFDENIGIAGSEDYLLWLKMSARFHIYHSNIVTSKLTHHSDRSVLNINPKNLIKRKELMIEEALSDKAIKEFYGTKIKYLKENTNSYISLHLAMAKHKRESFIYYIKSIKIRPLFLFSKRSLVIVKRLIF